MDIQLANTLLKNEAVMKYWITFSILFVLAMGGIAKLTLSAYPGRSIPVYQQADFRWQPCWFKIPSSKMVQCGYFYPSDNESQQFEIRLPVVVIKNPEFSNSDHIKSLVYLSGGPGSPTGLDADSIEQWWSWIDSNEWPANLVLFDQRGSGLSSPKLECPNMFAMIKENLQHHLTPKEEVHAWREAAQQCHEQLQKQGIQLSHYNTTRSSQDVSELMTLLGEKNWHLYGVSYGTRLALETLRNFPEQVQSVILDSSYPPHVNELLEKPFIYDNAFNILINSCQAHVDCQAKFPNLQAHLEQLLHDLHTQPVTLYVTDPRNKTPINFILNDHRLFDVIFNALYNWESLQVVPAAIEGMIAGNHALLQSLVNDYVDLVLSESFSYAAYLSIECHDQPPVSRESFLASLENFPRVKPYLEDQWDYNLCQIWQVGQARPEFQQPVQSSTPTLILAGEYDPATPLNWAQQTVETLDQGYLVPFPGLTHGVVDSDFCASEVVKNFLHNPNEYPNHECLSWPNELDFLLEEEEQVNLLLLGGQ